MVACFVLFSWFFFACFYQVILQVTACMILFWHVGKLVYSCAISFNFSYPWGPCDRTGLSLIKHDIRFGKIRTHDVIHTSTINNQNSKFDLTLFVAPSLTATSQVKQPTGRSPSAPDCQPAAGSASKYLEPEFLSITMSGISLSLSLPLLSYFLSMCTAVYVLLSQAK